jgi:hypothetical protein
MKLSPGQCRLRRPERAALEVHANIVDSGNYMYAIVNCIGEFARAEV